VKNQFENNKQQLIKIQKEETHLESKGLHKTYTHIVQLLNNPFLDEA
jgi:hypothetical protein